MSTAAQMVIASPPYEGSARTLGIASAAAFLAALFVLILFVLPAERGIDPTGIGSALGLTKMSDGAAETPEAAPAIDPAATSAVAPSGQAISKSTPMRSDEMAVVLKPHSGIELKARMRAGDHMIFRWEASAPVKVDMHGERPNAQEGEFTSFWKERALSSAQGAYTARFDGTHGWYWRNRSETDITIKLNTAGFYEALFQPEES
jgi:hypothetical protein